jgi:hypothetical protein
LEPSSDTTTTQSADPVTEATECPAKPAPPLEQAAEKATVKIRRTRTSAPNPDSKDSSASPRDTIPIEFPEGLDKDIIFVPSESLLESSGSSLPPQEIFEEALHKLLIALHPQNQARALLPFSGSSRPIEPTLGLYCPIEGGDDIIDSTVNDLAFHTGSEVLVLDAVHLAAGEWGKFGRGTKNLALYQRCITS